MPRVGVANPSSISSEISTDRASGSRPLVIVHHPGRLAGVTPGRLMGHSHAGNLAGVKPWRVVCINGGLIESRGKPVVKKRRGGTNVSRRFAASKQHRYHMSAPAKPSGGKSSLPSGVPPYQIPQRCTPEITPLIYPTMLTGGRIFLLPVHICGYHRWLQEMPCL